MNLIIIDTCTWNNFGRHKVGDMIIKVKKNMYNWLRNPINSFDKSN